MKKRIFPQFDGLRAVAALAVVIHHFWPESMRWDPSGGRVAVDLFFVLSGYLITRTLLQSRVETGLEPGAILKRFHRRRIKRIFPVYYVTLALACLIPSERAVSMLWHAGFLSNVYFVWRGHYVGAGAHLWALAVEQHFYLFWPPVVLWIPRKRLPSAAVAMIGTGLLFRVIGGWQGWSVITLDIMTPAAFEALGAGALLAHWMETREDAPERGGRWISTMGVIGAGLWGMHIVTTGTILGRWEWFLSTELSRSLMITWIIAQAVWGIPGWIGQMLESAAARSLGRWSYAIYLSHNFIFAMMKARPHHLIGLSVYDSQAVLALLLTLLWSMACYHLLEKPLMITRSSPARFLFST